jgi:O-methyltransferase
MTDIPPSLLASETIAALLTLAETTPPGAFVELGVYRGGSAWHLAQLARWQGRALHLFDTFSGIPEAGPFDREHSIGDFADTSLDAVRRAVPDAVFHVGVFPNTMPGDLKEIAFVHVDCDQYTACVAAIKIFMPLLVSKGIILFDDYGCTSGVTRAVEEMFGFGGFNLTAQGKAWVRK